MIRVLKGVVMVRMTKISVSVTHKGQVVGVLGREKGGECGVPFFSVAKTTPLSSIVSPPCCNRGTSRLFHRVEERLAVKKR